MNLDSRKCIFTKKLQELRGKETKRSISAKLGVLPQVYQRYESGEREPDFETLSKICNLFGVSSDWMLGLSNSRDRKIVHPDNQKPVVMSVAESECSEYVAGTTAWMERAIKAEAGLHSALETIAHLTATNSRLTMMLEKSDTQTSLPPVDVSKKNKEKVG